MLLVAGARQQDVSRLDVPVDEAAGVRCIEGGGDLPPEPCDPIGSQRTVAAQDRAHVLTVDEAHRDVAHAGFGAGLVHGDDVGMLERDRDLHLLVETGPRDSVLARPSGPQELQRDTAAEGLVERGVHDAHAAATDLFLDEVAADAALGAGGIRRRHVGVGYPRLQGVEPRRAGSAPETR